MSERSFWPLANTMKTNCFILLSCLLLTSCAEQGYGYGPGYMGYGYHPYYGMGYGGYYGGMHSGAYMYRNEFGEHRFYGGGFENRAFVGRR